MTNQVIVRSGAGATSDADILVAENHARATPGADGGMSLGSIKTSLLIHDELALVDGAWKIRKRTVSGGAGPERLIDIGAAPGGVAGGSTAPAASAETPVLTADDYAEITQLYTRYGPTYDSAADDGHMFSDLFAPGGRHYCGLCRSTRPFVYIEGRESLAMFSTGALHIGGHNAAGLDDGGVSIEKVPPNGGHTDRLLNHQVSNLVIDPVPGGVNVRSYLSYVAPTGDGSRANPQSGGVYYDFVVKTKDGWRWKHKNVLFIGYPLPGSIAPSFRDAQTVGAR